MDYTKTGRDLSVKLIRDFNLFTVRRLAPLVEDVDSVRIDLASARLVDSEAVQMLYAMVRAGKRVTLVHAPEILAEVIEILGLGGVLDVDALNER